MAYHTPVYLLLFLPVVLAVYQLTPQKKRWLVLLSASYFFVWLISGQLILYLWGTSLITHYTVVRLTWIKRYYAEDRKDTPEEKKKRYDHYKKKEKQILFFGIILLLIGLGYLKYYNFFVINVNALGAIAGWDPLLKPKSLVLPIGISFYTLQAVGYMADVYWNKAEVSMEFGKTALFLAFFPQIMEGPISQYSQTADQIWQGRPLMAENMAQGTIRIMWGLFKKLVIADRLYVYVAAVFDHYEEYHGIIVAAAAIAYTVQLYMEFSGCMDMVIGTGNLFGVSLPENFRQPMFAVNAADFWRRWHITLGTWFRTYIFYPVSVSKPVKKWNRFGRKHKSRQAANIGLLIMTLFPVWLCNGLWHGAKWGFVFYGMYYFVILLLEGIYKPVHDRILKGNRAIEESFFYKAFRIIKTWVIIVIGELFFRAEGFRIGVRMFRSLFQEFSFHELWDGTFLGFGLDKADYLVIFFGCLVIAATEFIKEKKLPGSEGICRQKLPVRWAAYYVLILSVVILGAYGTGYQQVDLIYAGF